ncbi:hypothetical protein WMY93_010589 [Mugilogobius chulae]|uniref:Reverse transcriptase domain-containing protein n=1 Tax=Mugilogobius chulae TaxID=88201 RepID=A0AAW0P7T1_9GOBI
MKEKARIEAEAAQRKAELEANLYVLKTEKTATAASAEAAVYEAAAAMENDPLNDLGQIPPQDTAQRTNEYVQAHYAPDPQQEAPVLQQPPVTSSNAQRAPSPPPPPLSSSSLSSNQVQWYPLPNRITPEDNKPAMSIEDKMFLELMDNEVYMDDDNHWVAPLPFRNPRPLLPNNREQALKRLAVLKRTLDKKPDMKKQFVEFMDKIFENDQAEIAPELQPDEECWYLPIFGVYHPQKPDKIRAVFDSSAQFNGISLNDTLIRGPDLNNTLLGVLLRFRREQVAVTVDVEQMFYCFRVKESHRNYLRFLWFKDNDLNKEITEYRMKVPVFGNSPSPAIAIYGLRKAAELGQEEHGSSAKEFVFRNFYVGDGLTSVSSESEAIELLTSARNMLAESNIRLHKIASNASQVMNAFPQEERATDLKDLDLDVDPLPLQRSLGVSWNLENDSFTFRVGKDTKPFTRRGILSVINSLYDPLGFAAPVTIQGKALYRN